MRDGIWVSRLILIQNARIRGGRPCVHRCVPASRTPGLTWPEHHLRMRKHVLELDRADQVDHGAAHDPQRMGVSEAHLAQLVLADVLDVAATRVPVGSRRCGRRHQRAAALAVEPRRVSRPAPASLFCPGSRLSSPLSLVAQLRLTPGVAFKLSVRSCQALAPAAHHSTTDQSGGATLRIMPIAAR